MDHYKENQEKINNKLNNADQATEKLNSITSGQVITLIERTNATLEQTTKTLEYVNQNVEKINTYKPKIIGLVEASHITESHKSQLRDKFPDYEFQILSGNMFIGIQGKIKDVSQIICLIFEDEKGEPLSQATVLTYLSPNRTDKDPNNDIKVRF